ncbi:hypothetical protein PT931_20190 [Longispora urticae]
MTLTPTGPHGYGNRHDLEIAQALGEAAAGRAVEVVWEDGTVVVVDRVDVDLPGRAGRDLETWRGDLVDALTDDPGEEWSRPAQVWIYDPHAEFTALSWPIGQALGTAAAGRRAWLISTDGIALDANRRHPGPGIIAAAQELSTRAEVEHPDPDDRAHCLRAQKLHNFHAAHGHLPTVETYRADARYWQSLTRDDAAALDDFAARSLATDAEALAAYPLPAA